MDIKEINQLYAGMPQAGALVAALGKGGVRSLALEGLVGSAAPVVFASVAGRLPSVLLFVLADADDAGYFYHDLVQLLGDGNVLFFPSSYRRAVKYGQRDAASEILRTEVLARVAGGTGEGPSVGGGFLYIVSYPDAVAELVSYELDLTAEALSLQSDAGDGGYTPAYLKGTGTVHVTVRSDAGRGEADLDISTDGSYALPLSAERQSLFESMAGDGGISVSQMMTYQLTSLAQYRVMNGYGAMSEYGSKGTVSIITADDVRAAYRNALEAVSMICFRDGDGSLSKYDRADLSDLLASEDGRIVLDLSAVYSQALMSVIDDVALSWFDYVMGFQILDGLDQALNPFRNAVMALAAFLLGEEEVYSAVPYIEKTMELAGIDPDEYGSPGAGTSTVTAAGITVTVENPTSDVLSKGWLKDFKKRYSGDTNFVMEFILDVLRHASVSLAESMDLGVVSVDVDPYDDTPFLDTLALLFDRAVADGMSAVEDAISGSLGSSTAYDPFYGAIADEIYAHADEFILSSELESRLVSAWTSAIPEGSGITPQTLLDSGELERALHSYKASVRDDLALFDELRRVADGEGVVKRVLTEICAFGLGAIGITDCVPERMGTMCDEILAINAMNPHGGVTDLPGTTDFRLDDGSGMMTSETLDAEIGSELIVEEVTIDRERCVHTVGFREESSAAYSTWTSGSSAAARCPGPWGHPRP